MCGGAPDDPVVDACTVWLAYRTRTGECGLRQSAARGRTSSLKPADEVFSTVTSLIPPLVPVFVVFIIFQRYLVEGISTAGLSGR